MKLSVEVKVAAAVGAGFVAVTFGAIGQVNNAGRTVGAKEYSPTRISRHDTYVSQQAYNRSLAATNAKAEESSLFSR